MPDRRMTQELPASSAIREKLPRGAGPGTDDSLQTHSKMIRDAGTSLARLRNPNYGFDIQLAPPARKSVSTRKVSKR